TGAKKGAFPQDFGRSRGGFTSKTHARYDNQGRPLGFVLAGRQVSDCTATDALMKLPAPPPKAMLADRSYDRTALSCMNFLKYRANLWNRSFTNVA
ncbi:transposase, partial [Gluconobacter aidae]